MKVKPLKNYCVFQKYPKKQFYLSMYPWQTHPTKVLPPVV